MTIDAATLTGSNRISVFGANLNGSDTITGGAGDDVINGGTGADSSTGGAVADIIILNGSGAMTGDTINGGTGNDTLRLDAEAPRAPERPTDATISNIDRIAFNATGASFSVTVTDAQVSSADSDQDQRCRATCVLSLRDDQRRDDRRLDADRYEPHHRHGGANMGGADTITGGAGDDIISAGRARHLTGGTGADTLM